MNAWMIKRPTGKLFPVTSRETKTSCIFWFCVTRNEYWSNLTKRGFKCVRVEIKEAK